MATIVEISKTNHLSYSPLNEKHNILYHRARQNVNQRHIQKPWFDMNPFIDKDDDKGIDLNAYRPDNDRGVQALESLTIVEDYFSDKPLLTREFKIGQFWDFLFSEDWADGYSLRILEGRLQNLMYTCLLTLTQSGRVAQHSTRAFAKNRRKRYSVYKPSKKPPELGQYEETLLLEFIYYGHVVSTSGLGDDGSSVGYPQTTTCSTVTNISSDLESSDQDAKAAFLSFIPSTELLKPIPPSVPKPTNQRRKLLQKRALAPRVTPQSPGRDKMLINKSLSRVQEAGHSVAMIPRGTRKKKHRSDVSSGSEDCFNVPQELDLSKFMCTEKVSYLGEFDLPDDSSSSSDESDYGQELYIGDRGASETPDPTESVESKLKRRKNVVKQRREERRQVLEKLNKPAKPIVPEFSALDIRKYLSNTKLSKQEDANKPTEKVPDLVEFIKMMKDDERNDPRFGNKSKRRTLRYMEKYNLVKPRNERFADEVGGVTDSQACRLHCYGMDNSWKIMSEETKKKFLIRKLIKAGGKIQMKSKKKTTRDRRGKRKLKVPLIYITTISGITYMHQVSRSLLQTRMKEEEEKSKPTSGAGRRRMSLLPNEQAAIVAKLNQRRQSYVPGFLEPIASLEARKESKPLFPKAKPQLTGIESPDFDSDDESDDLTNIPFDTNRLHMQYSMERINRTKAERRKKNNELPQFLQVLKKYYRMQAILKAFTPASKQKSAGYRASVLGPLPTAKPKPRKLRRNIFRATNIDGKEEHRVGKIKWFSFLDTKRKLMEPIDDMDEPLFENYPMELFRKNVERALEEFVVRREVVISDYNAKASVSITLTKKSVFVQSRVQ